PHQGERGLISWRTPMAISSKNYPKAIPCHSPEELALQNARLNQANEELAAQSRRLTQWNEDLARRAARLRLWTLRLLGVCAALIALSGAGMVFAFKYPELMRRSSNSPLPQTPGPGATTEPKTAPPITAPKVAPTELPPKAIAKPDATAAVHHK